MWLHTGATYKHMQAHTNMRVYSYFEYLVNMEKIICFSKAIAFDTKREILQAMQKILSPDKRNCFTNVMK